MTTIPLSRGLPARPFAGPARRALATLVLALATGLPLRSAGRLTPEADDAPGPFLGV